MKNIHCVFGSTYKDLKRLNNALIEQIHMLTIDDEEQQKVIIEQAKRIKKAIEYIKEKQKLNNMFGTITLSKDSQNELLEILGDKENE